MINLLGEHYEETLQAEKAVEEYKGLADEIRRQGAEASLTIKPSQFGFNAKVKGQEALCRRNMLEVLGYAKARGIPIWLDMEDSRFTDFTIAFYEENSGKYDLGICLQANLKRTKMDLKRLIAISGKKPVKVRLVKGIYPENARIAITDRKKLHERLLALIRFAFEESPESFGIAVGSHHEEAVELALRLQRKHRKRFFEIQVLKGVLPEYYARLRSRGARVAEYVPYGKEAFAYSVRRARKNPRFASSVIFGVFFDAYKKLYG